MCSGARKRLSPIGRTACSLFATMLSYILNVNRYCKIHYIYRTINLFLPKLLIYFLRKKKIQSLFNKLIIYMDNYTSITNDRADW